MDALCTVDQLRHGQIHRQGTQDIGVASLQPFLVDQKIDHFTCGHTSRLIQIRMQAHRDEVSRCLSPGAGQGAVLVKEDLDRSSKRSFQGGQGDLSVPLECVAVSK